MNTQIEQLSAIGFKATATTITLVEHAKLTDARYAKFLEVLKEFENVEELHLAKAKLSKERIMALTAALQCPTALHILDLSVNTIGVAKKNNLGAVVSLIVKLVNLQSINLSVNSIDDNNVKQLAKSFKKLTALQSIDLGSNYLTNKGVYTLTDHLSHLAALKQLVLCENHDMKIREPIFSEMLKRLPFSVEFDLSDDKNSKNEFEGQIYFPVQNTVSSSSDDDSSEEEQETRAANKFLAVHKEVSTRSDVSSSDEEIVEEPTPQKVSTHSIEELPVYDMNVAVLNLADTNIGIVGAKKIAEDLKANTTLRELDLQDNHIDDQGAILLADALLFNTTLQKLNLQYNRVGDEGAEKIAKLLETNITLQEIALDAHRINTPYLATNIELALLTNRTLFTGQKYDNGVDEVKVGKIIHALRSNQHLQILELHCVTFEEGEVENFAKALGENGALQSLYLNCCQISDNGFAKFIEALKSNTSLVTLRLHEMLCDNDAEKIADFLVSNTKLTTLNLEGNWIGDWGAKKIAEALKSNSTLKILNLDNNAIGDEGGENIAEAIRKNGKVQVKLFGNNMSEQGKEKIEDVVPFRTAAQIETKKWADQNLTKMMASFENLF